MAIRKVKEVRAEFPPPIYKERRMKGLFKAVFNEDGVKNKDRYLLQFLNIWDKKYNYFDKCCIIEHIQSLLSEEYEKNRELYYKEIEQRNEGDSGFHVIEKLKF